MRTEVTQHHLRYTQAIMVWVWLSLYLCLSVSLSLCLSLSLVRTEVTQHHLRYTQAIMVWVWLSLYLCLSVCLSLVRTEVTQHHLRYTQAIWYHNGVGMVISPSLSVCLSGCLSVCLSVSLSLSPTVQTSASLALASASRADDPGFEFRLRRDFSGSIHTGDLKTGIPVATLSCAWRCGVSAGDCRQGDSILWARWKVGSATSISVWQHVQLSEQIRA